MRVGGLTLARVATLIDSHQLSSSFDRALRNNIGAFRSFLITRDLKIDTYGSTQASRFKFAVCDFETLLRLEEILQNKKFKLAVARRTVSYKWLKLLI